MGTGKPVSSVILAWKQGFCPHLGDMERRTRFNIIYLGFALLAILVLQQWWQTAQTVEVMAYSEFEKLLGYVAEAEMVHRDNLVLAAVAQAGPATPP